MLVWLQLLQKSETIRSCCIPSDLLSPTLINVVQEGDALIAISLRERTWWRNLRGGRIAQLRVSGKRYFVRGEIIDRHEGVVAGLANYFKRYPAYAKHFRVRLGADGQPKKEELERVANERVIIRLRPE